MKADLSTTGQTALGRRVRVEVDVVPKASAYAALAATAVLLWIVVLPLEFVAGLS